MEITLSPIGFITSAAHENYQVLHQAGASNPTSTLTLLKTPLAKQSLEELSGFSHVWIIFYFHKAKVAKAKVLPPGRSKKVGIYATRSPHRHNHLGMSVVPLLSIDELTLHLGPSDLLDGTPVLDIKPYITSCDSLVAPRQGWITERKLHPIKHIAVSDSAAATLTQESLTIPLEVLLERRTRRVARINETDFILAYKNYRVRIHEKADSYEVLSIRKESL